MLCFNIPFACFHFFWSLLLFLLQNLTQAFDLDLKVAIFTLEIADSLLSFSNGIL